jgi:hypothetical protein
MLAKGNKPILETCKNKSELLPTKKALPKEKAGNLKTCLLKTKTQNADLKKCRR